MNRAMLNNMVFKCMERSSMIDTEYPINLWDDAHLIKCIKFFKPDIIYRKNTCTVVLGGYGAEKRDTLEEALAHSIGKKYLSEIEYRNYTKQNIPKPTYSSPEGNYLVLRALNTILSNMNRAMLNNMVFKCMERSSMIDTEYPINLWDDAHLIKCIKFFKPDIIYRKNTCTVVLGGYGAEKRDTLEEALAHSIGKKYLSEIEYRNYTKQIYTQTYLF